MTELEPVTPADAGTPAGAVERPPFQLRPDEEAELKRMREMEHAEPQLPDPPLREWAVDAATFSVAVAIGARVDDPFWHGMLCMLIIVVWSAAGRRLVDWIRAMRAAELASHR